MILALFIHTQLVVSKRMFDAGVIATARAAEIYGLNIVAKAIQVLNSCMQLKFLKAL